VEETILNDVFARRFIVEIDEELAKCGITRHVSVFGAREIESEMGKINDSEVHVTVMHIIITIVVILEVIHVIGRISEERVIDGHQPIGVICNGIIAMSEM
jgi:hypothetical protein